MAGGNERFVPNDLYLNATTHTVLVLTGRPDDAWLANWSRAEAAVSHPLDPVVLGRAVLGLLRTPTR